MKKFRIVEHKKTYLDGKNEYIYHIERKFLGLFWKTMSDYEDNCIIEFCDLKSTDLFLEAVRLLDRHGSRGKFNYSWGKLYFEGLVGGKSSPRILVQSDNRDELLGTIKSLLVDKVEKNIIE